MRIQLVRSDEIYRKMMQSPEEKRNDIYRYEMMKPFAFKWACIHVPIKAAHPGGYDVVMASEMLGFLPPSRVDEAQKGAIEKISDDCLWQQCENTIRDSMERFQKAGFAMEVSEYVFALMLANPESPYVKMSDGYAGDGGIPGYILVSLVPSAYTIGRVPAALAHECNHNVRWQFQKWNMQVTLADMMVSEGLAENFATTLYGEKLLGPWVSKTDMETLNTLIKPIIRKGLDATGFENITAYLYGDELAQLQGYFPVGLPYCAGYACGYHLIKHYLKKTGKTIEEATFAPTAEIMKEAGDFWDQATC